jgi:uncharacterized SAM-binding protein YcdF (DUF218 family)
MGVISELLWLLVKPSYLLLCCLALGLLLHRWVWGWRLLLGAAAAIVVCGFFPVGGLLILPLERRFGSPAGLDRADGIIVLAGAELPRASRLHGHPQFNLYTDRLTTFLLLANRFGWFMRAAASMPAVVNPTRRAS